MDGTAGSGGAGKNKEDLHEFLGILEANFKGRKCYLGQYSSSKTASGTNDDGDGAENSPAVGSLVVTLEAPEKLVVGAFIRPAVGGDWEYWEGEFGPSELEAHRNSLGWDDHSLKTLGDCFVAAVDDTTQPWQSQACAAADVTEADEHRQRPPEFSNVGDAGSGNENDTSTGPGGEQPNASDTGTLDLHYAGAGIVGSWDIRRVQGGVSAAMMNSMRRSIRAACWKKPTDDAEPPAAASASASSSRPKPLGAHKAKRQRFAGKGATLIGAQSSGDS
eukprot:g7651.t1